MKFTNIGLLGISFVAAALVAPASVERLAWTDVDHVRSATVYVADLDLGRESDARILYERIEDAAQSLCMTELTFDTKTNRRQCVESAIAGAIDRANVPLLTSIHQRRERADRL